MASSIVFCSNCGVQNPASDRFCSSCGLALSTSAPAVVATASSSRTGQLVMRTMLKQRYRVLQPIGKGGMGAVYVAQDTLLGNRSVAIKEMSQSNLSADEKKVAVESFTNEAYMLAGLQHPNLPSIYDHFEESGRWYLVMSFIEGETLGDYVSHARDQRLSLEETLQIGQTLCNVLQYLHHHQPPIIFRDLKPSNIMRSPEGNIYLIDFGIARHFKPGQTRDTANFGSAGYAPPEQYGRAQTTERSDIYSLGATLFELLSGYDPARSPFRFPPLQSLVPSLPDRLVRLISQMLELDESKRPASIQVVQQELQQIIAFRTNTPTPYAPPPLLPPSPAAQMQPQYGQITIQQPPNWNPGYAPLQYPANRKTHSGINTTLSIVMRVLSIIGIIIGSMSILIGILGAFISGEGIFNDTSYGGLFIFLGLMIIFMALIRKRSFPVSRIRKAKSLIGLLVSIIALIFGITIAIYGGITDTPANGNGGAVLVGILIVILGVVIWLVTHIWSKKAPQLGQVIP